MIYTPTYSIALVLLVLVVVSIAVEQLFHVLDQFFVRTKQRELAEVLHRIRDELMLLGFISLILSLCGPGISKICVKDPFNSRFLTCPYPYSESATDADAGSPAQEPLLPPPPVSNDSFPPPSSFPLSNQTAKFSVLQGRGLSSLPQESSFNTLVERFSFLPGSFRYLTTRRHLRNKDSLIPHPLLDDAGVRSQHLHGRFLEGSAGESTCPVGMQPFITQEGLHQLHLFVFLVTLLHIIFSWLAIFLALLRLRIWRQWEEAAQKECKSMTRRSLSKALHKNLNATVPSSYAARQLLPMSVLQPSPIAMVTGGTLVPNAPGSRALQPPGRSASSRFNIASLLPQTAPAKPSSLLSTREVDVAGVGEGYQGRGGADDSSKGT